MWPNIVICELVTAQLFLPEELDLKRRRINEAHVYNFDASFPLHSIGMRMAARCGVGGSV
jgi:hypothetical protein